MAFRFRLETLLRFRRNVEEREWLKTRALAQQLLRLQSELDSLRECMQNESALLSDAIRAGVTASEMHFARECEESRRQLHAALGARMLDVKKQYEAQNASFLDARRDREVIESLRKQQYSEYAREEARREQSEADQMFLLRREVRRNALPTDAGRSCPAAGDQVWITHGE